MAETQRSTGPPNWGLVSRARHSVTRGSILELTAANGVPPQAPNAAGELVQPGTGAEAEKFKADRVEPEGRGFGGAWSGDR